MLLMLLVAACGQQHGKAKAIVLGFDGMDHALARKLIDEGRLPNLARLEREGSFGPLATSVPPQSPVAWSDFITGTDAGGHGIFDFIHRDPKTMTPYLSTSRTRGAERVLKLGRWQLPLSSGKVELLRRGEAFWEALEAAGVRTTIVRIPANFPPSGTAMRELSGMGTPDILGTYGTFTIFTSNVKRFASVDPASGRVAEAVPHDNVVRAELLGPPNPFRTDPRPATAPFELGIDPEQPLAALVIGDERRLLIEGEWSDWVPVRFTLAPTQSLATICRFYLKSVRPELALYVSPLNIDPLEPALPISTPASFAAEMARAGGRFYTQGMPEDTKALSSGVFTPAEFLAQARIAQEEVAAQYRLLLDRFDGGLLFYYFSNADQVQHMMFRSLDPGHPAYDPAVDGPLADVIPGLYAAFDTIVGETLARIDPDTLLVVMSDHGFASWRRSISLNAWLRDNGYLSVRGGAAKPGVPLANVNWAATRAYGLGINGLYLNLAGREKWGIVSAAERGRLLDVIAARLLATADPATGRPAITRVFRRDATFADLGARDIGPDLVIGYAKGTRCSDASALGEVSREVFTDNTAAWSGDHCMDPEAVPGILATNRPLRTRPQRLRDLAAAILDELGISGFPPAAPRARQKGAQ